ncbi:MAG: G5 domain-containing protein, partial [Clostridia bacterium]|nr:G5 domain-containing protein [Clostridia bacterium]
SMDIISPSLDSVVNKDTQITITKITSEMVSVQEEIAFTIIQTPNSNLDRGETRVVQEGKAGTKEVMYNVTYSNGEELSREEAGERIVTEPVNKIVEYGTKYASVSRGGTVSRVTDPSTQLNYTRTVTVSATAYDLSFESCGKNPGDRGYGITASGMKASRGIIAVDPRVIPMGSKLYIESLDGSPDYGYAIAGDKGGAIKGNKIDLFMDTRAECMRWGRRNVKVYILAE